MSDSVFITLDKWAEKKGISVRDALNLCKRKKINTSKLGNSRFAIEGELELVFAGEIKSQREKIAERNKVKEEVVN
jgi:hypothetical protein